MILSERPLRNRPHAHNRGAGPLCLVQRPAAQRVAPRLPYCLAASRHKARLARPLSAVGALVLTALMVGGCTSPPSAVPLMQVTRKALKQEKAHLKRMKKQRRALLSERQQALKAGFTADLKHRDELTKQWVKSGVKGYVAAREALLRQHVQAQQRYEQRLANLDAAMRAQGRAISLLQRQDRLITDTLGGEVWDVPQLLTDDPSE